MHELALRNIESEDIHDVLLKVQSSFGLNFQENEFSDIKTFGEFSDYIISLIKAKPSEGCTTQQAFYKLRKAVDAVLRPESPIQPDSILAELVQSKHRQGIVRSINTELGFKAIQLRMPNWLCLTLVAMLLLSLIALFFYPIQAITGIAFSILALSAANRDANIFELSTAGQVAEKMTKEYYLKSRSKALTYNPDEIENILAELFILELCLEPEQLTRETLF